MRPKKHCKNFLPWVVTSRGERNDYCVDKEKRTMKYCDACIDKKLLNDKRKKSTNPDSSKKDCINKSADDIDFNVNIDDFVSQLKKRMAEISREKEDNNEVKDNDFVELFDDEEV